MSKSCIEHGQNFLATSQQPQVNTTRTQIVIIQESSTSCNVILTEGRANCGRGPTHSFVLFQKHRNGLLKWTLFTTGKS